MPRLSPVFNDAQLDNNGRPAVGYRVFTWLSGSFSKRATSTDAAGGASHTNPIILNSRGEPDSPIHLDEGVAYRMGIAPPGTDDPPDTLIRVPFDEVHGIGDALTGAIVQWIESGVTPVFISTTRFTLAGDQTSNFDVGRRLRLQTIAGTVYGEVSASVFTTLTTVDVQMSVGVLDAGLTSVAYGIVSSVNSSNPLPSRAILSSPLTAFENLIITTPSVSTATIFADKVVVRNILDQAAILENVNVTVNLAASGVNGLDTGAEAISTGYFLWVIWNGTTKAGLLSVSSATPTLPTGYTHKGLVGAVFNNASGNFINTDQRGKFVSIPEEFILSLGSATTITGLSLASAIPPNVFRALVKVTFLSPSAGVSGQLFSDVGELFRVGEFGDAVGGNTESNYILALLRTSQSLWYKVSNAGADMTVSVIGYIW